MAATRRVRTGKVGQPRIELDKEVFEGLCELQCTRVEIASFFKVSEDTIERWCARTYDKKFSDVYKERQGAGKVRLRRLMMQQAETSPAMAIFLSKNWLGMTDKQAVEVNHTDDSSKAMDAFFEAKKAQQDEINEAKAASDE